MWDIITPLSLSLSHESSRLNSVVLKTMCKHVLSFLATSMATIAYDRQLDAFLIIYIVCEYFLEPFSKFLEVFFLGEFTFQKFRSQLNIVCIVRQMRLRQVSPVSSRWQWCARWVVIVSRLCRICVIETLRKILSLRRTIQEPLLCITVFFVQCKSILHVITHVCHVRSFRDTSETLDWELLLVHCLVSLIRGEVIITIYFTC